MQTTFSFTQISTKSDSFTPPSKYSKTITTKLYSGHGEQKERLKFFKKLFVFIFVSLFFEGMAITHGHGQFFFFHIFLLFLPLTSSSSDSDALLKLKQSFTNPNALDSWVPGTEPCAHDSQWIGIICENGVVAGLRLGHLGLSGTIDVDALNSMPGLRSIGIMSNSFSGPIPDFHKLVGLRGLYLTHNQFSGEIPGNYFSNMELLRKLWLSGNNFSGPIPSSLGQLKHLMELHMEQNHFSGTIPQFQQQGLISIDLSNNQLEGEIPAGLSKFSTISFDGNVGLCGRNIGKPCQTAAEHKNLQGSIKISISVLGVSFALLLLMILGIYIMRKKQERSEFILGHDDLSVRSTSLGKKDFESFTTTRGFGSSHRVMSSGKASVCGKGIGDLVMINSDYDEFGLADLMKAAAEVLGNGALGSSYKAAMATGLTVVVKRMKEIAKMGKAQFDAEMRRLGSLQHENVLTPLAYHYRKDEKLLVNEFQPKGSLLLVLHGDRLASRMELTWPLRLKIVQGVARGLGYLHTKLSALNLPHGDLKSSNVLLTPNFEPLLTDYGFCALISSSRATQALNAYKSPEAVLDNNNISPKCDVYCLGIIILEVVTGKFPCQYLNGKGGTDVVQWVRSAISEGRESDLCDQDIVKAAPKCVGEMEKLLHIGAACTENNPDMRLDIREAIARIDCLRVDDYENRAKSLHTHVPSLRHGYADEVASHHPPVLEHLRSIEDQSGRESFGFQIS